MGLTLTSFHSHPEKPLLRRLLRQQRAALSPDERARAEWRVAQQARMLGYLRPGSKIAAYIPVASEFSAWPLILLALQRGVDVYLPQVPLRGRKLCFVRLDARTRWQDGQYGIPEPLHRVYCPVRSLDAVFLPLLGFDAQGGRLGQGGGYYDTTFAFRRCRTRWKKPRLIGLAFSCQQTETLVLDHWDVRLDRILTGEAVYPLLSSGKDRR